MNEKSANRAVKAGGKSQYRWVMLALVMLVYIIVLGFTNQSFNILLASIAVKLYMYLYNRRIGRRQAG